MSPSTRSYYASLIGAVVLLVLACVVGLITIPAILDMAP